jgi:hypothetical protein
MRPMPGTEAIEPRTEWFVMIVNYLKLKSMAVWFQLHPESSYEQFDAAWPFMLDQMMSNATRCCVEMLQSIVESSLN